MFTQRTDINKCQHNLFGNLRCIKYETSEQDVIIGLFILFLGIQNTELHSSNVFGRDKNNSLEGKKSPTEIEHTPAAFSHVFNSEINFALNETFCAHNSTEVLRKFL